MGRCIYGGIYDPGNPLSDENGFRKDVLQALEDLNIPVVRYPGGNFCATYHWLDGVGPKDKRPARYVLLLCVNSLVSWLGSIYLNFSDDHRPELAWLGTETNQFGTDEFMKWCEALGTEPYLCFNFGTGTLDEGLSLLAAWREKLLMLSSPGLGGILQRQREYLLREPSPSKWPRAAIQCTFIVYLTRL